jgi:hypothetical protein
MTTYLSQLGAGKNSQSSELCVGLFPVHEGQAWQPNPRLRFQHKRLLHADLTRTCGGHRTPMPN